MSEDLSECVSVGVMAVSNFLVCPGFKYSAEVFKVVWAKDKFRGHAGTRVSLAGSMKTNHIN